ncbi:hypothetical protein J4734_25430 [Klebsiella pneumoniae]|uniref:Thiosulfate sulfurtransferase n=1 Tax=Klebsiella pneumoniae TaxID=573 RepID=A0A939NTP9_KLEPN|nr:hypothetical protein [Klebsiella pneumoniae]
MESEPLWNKVSDAQLKAMLAKHGIRHDTTVILYGRDVYAAARWRRSCCTPGSKTCACLTAAGRLVRRRAAGRARYAAGAAAGA